MKKQQQVVMTQAPDQAEVPAHVIAQSIREIALAMYSLSNSDLKRKAIVALIHDQSKINKSEIEIVLNNLERLREDWTNL